MKKVSLWLVVSLFCGIFLWGCSGVEPEKRQYPQVIGVDWQQDLYQIILALPDMQSTTGQEKSGEGENISLLGFRGKNLEEIENAYNLSQEKYLDVGHVQVLILGPGIVQKNRWEEVFTVLQDEPMLGEDIYVFVTDDLSNVMNYNGTQGDALGDYLVGIYENRPCGQTSTGVTLRQLYKTWYESGKLQSLPQVYINSEGYPEIQ